MAAQNYPALPAGDVGADKQIRQVLSFQAETTTVEQVIGNPQLLDLARGPIMTELIPPTNYF